MGNKKRGSGTHGHGSSKKRRGGGSRGGRGAAGLGKKAKHKKIQGIRSQHLGEHGFNRPPKVVEEVETINLREIDRRIEDFVAAGVAEEKDGGYVFNATAAGYGKVLGGGELQGDIDIKAEAFSERARQKIEGRGSEAITTGDSESAEDGDAGGDEDA